MCVWLGTKFSVYFRRSRGVGPSCALCSLTLFAPADDEMFSDTFKVTVSEDGIFYEVEGKVSEEYKIGFDLWCFMCVQAQVDLIQINKERDFSPVYFVQECFPAK